MIRSEAEVVLIARCGTALTVVGKDGTTVNGSNPDLNDGLWYALDKLGYSIVSISSVSDGDVSAVTTEDIRPFIALAELRTLETVLNAATSLVDITVGPRRESLSQFSERLEKIVENYRANILRDFGDLFGSGLEAGVFSVSSMEDGENIY